MKKLLFTISLLSLAYIGVGQTTIWTLDFENPGGYTPSIIEFSDGEEDYFATIKMNGDEDAYDYSHNLIADVDNLSLNNLQGSYFFSGMDIDGEGASLPVNIQMTNIDINGYTSLNFSVFLTEDNHTLNAWDDDDYVHILYQIDDGGWENLIWIEANASGEAKIDTDKDGTGEGTTITDSFTEFSESITGTGSQIDIKVVFNLDSGDEDIAIDNLEIAGESVVDNPGSFTANTQSRSQIDLNFTTNGSNDNLIIVYDDNGTFTYPSGPAPSTGQAFAGGTLLYNGTTSPVSHNGLSSNQSVYYSAWSYDGSVYSPGVEDNAKTLPFLVITEIMQNPDAVSDNYGEWFEIFNAGSTSVNIDGYKIKDSGTDNHTINNEGSLDISSDSYLILGTDANTSTNGNVTVDYKYTGISLTNSDDEIILTMADDTEIDRVEYTGSSPWPNPTGASMTLNSNELENNNDGNNWYEATSTFGNGDYGTPGTANDFLTATWTGTESLNWNNATGWDSGEIPTNAYNVTIPSGSKLDVEIASDATAECNNLTVDGSLTIKSISLGTGSLIINGTATVNGTFTAERYIEGYTNNDDGWHLISSPVNSLDISGTDIEPDDFSGGEDDFYGWDEVNYQWDNYETWGSSTLTNGHGYLAAYQTTATHNFVGSPNTADIDVDLSYTGAIDAVDRGWNLLGNPFPSGLTWDNTDGSSDWTEIGNVQADAQVYNESSDTYDLVSDEGVIAPHQGFFVQANSSVTGFTIPAADRVHDNSNISKESKVEDGTLELKVYSSENTIKRDLLKIRLNNNSDDSYDRFDSQEFYGYGNTAQLFSIDEEHGNLSAHSVHPSSIEESRIFALGVQAVVEGNYAVTINENTFEADYEVKLEDLVTGEMIDIENVEAYEFTVSPDDAEHRFNLHLTKSSTIGLEENSELAGVHVYANKRNIYFNADENLTNATLTVYNTIGQVVLTTNVESGSEIIRIDDLGAYIVKVQTNEGSMSEKVIIQ